MVKTIMRDPLFLSQKSELATEADKQVDGSRFQYDEQLDKLEL